MLSGAFAVLQGAPGIDEGRRYSMDFLSDQQFDGRKIRMLSIIYNFSRISPALDVCHSYRGSELLETLD
jgi:putative transposase